VQEALAESPGTLSSATGRATVEPGARSVVQASGPRFAHSEICCLNDGPILPERALWIHPPTRRPGVRERAPPRFPQGQRPPGPRALGGNAVEGATLATSDAFSATAALIRSFPGVACAIPSRLESSAKAAPAPPAPLRCRRRVAFASRAVQTDVVEQPAPRQRFEGHSAEVSIHDEAALLFGQETDRTMEGRVPLQRRHRTLAVIRNPFQPCSFRASDGSAAPPGR